MQLIAKSSGGSDRPLPPAGMHHGILYAVVELGTQKNEYKGKTKIQRMFNVAWELPHAPKFEYEDNGEKITHPSCIFKRYVLSLFEKANLAKDLSSWRGQQFTKAEENGFDIFSMLKLNANALLNIVHYEGANGGMKAKYTSISPLMAGMVETLPENPTYEYTIAECGDNFPAEMLVENMQWMVDAIKTSPEYRRKMTGEALPSTPENEPTEAVQIDDDQIPF